MWSDACDRGRLKIGIARGPSSVVRRDVAALRRMVRTAGLRSVDLVAVPSTEAALRRAQDAIGGSGPRSDVVVTGPNPALNAIDVAATTGSGAAWERLREAARRERVTVVLERDESIDGPR